MPDFGANLRRYLFEPNDEKSTDGIKNEISEAVRKFLPNLTISELTTSPVEDNEHAVMVRIDYIVTTGAFQSSDFVTLQL
jgi:phage baseplate assembly protein W